MLTFIKDQREKFEVPGTCYLMMNFRWELGNIQSSICHEEKSVLHYNKNLKADYILWDAMVQKGSKWARKIWNIHEKGERIASVRGISEDHNFFVQAIREK